MCPLPAGDLISLGWHAQGEELAIYKECDAERAVCRLRPGRGDGDAVSPTQRQLQRLVVRVYEGRVPAVLSDAGLAVGRIAILVSECEGVGIRAVEVGSVDLDATQEAVEGCAHRCSGAAVGDGDGGFVSLDAVGHIGSI